jgi:hypothetical protein
VIMASFSLVNPNTTTDAASEEKYSIVHFQYNNNDLSIRKIPTGNIYKQTLLSRFNFRKGYKIMTVEKNISLPECKDIYLLSRDEIRTYRSKYQYLHIGLVQFAISDRIHTQFFEGKHRAVSLSVRLRDSKFQNLEDSILVSFKTTESEDGTAVKFNWFPNFSISLFDLANSNGLVVTVDPSNCVHLDLDVKYKLCYKLMKTSLKPDYLFGNPVVEVNTKITNFVVPQI